MQGWISGRPRRWLLRCCVAGAAVAALLLAGCSSSATPAAPSSVATEQEGTAPAEQLASVAVSGFLFQPEVIEVPAGTTVTWANTDKILHTATSGEPDAPSGLFDGQMEGAGTSFSFTFDDPGRFPFFCSRHLHMRGEVIVR